MRLSRREAVVAAAATLPACRRTAPAPALTTREVANVFKSQPTREGAGVNLHRALGHRELSVLDPFLLLDEFRSDPPTTTSLASLPTRTAASRR